MPQPTGTWVASRMKRPELKAELVEIRTDSRGLALAAVETLESLALDGRKLVRA
jgi:hypothetical protein